MTDDDRPSELEFALRASCLDPTARQPERPRRIGGGWAASLIGLNPYGNLVDLYAYLKHGLERPWTKGMKRGLNVETELMEHYKKHIGPIEAIQPVVESSEWPWATGHLDAFIPGGVLDIKSTSVWGAHQYGLPGSDEVKAYTLAQLTWYCGLSKREKWHVYLGVGVDLPDGGFSYDSTVFYQGTFDKELFDLMIRAAEKFMKENVEAGVWPEGPPICNKRDIKRLRAKDAWEKK